MTVSLIGILLVLAQSVSSPSHSYILGSKVSNMDGSRQGKHPVYGKIYKKDEGIINTVTN